MNSKELIHRKIPYYFTDNAVLFRWLLVQMIYTKIKSAIDKYVYKSEE